MEVLESLFELDAERGVLIRKHSRASHKAGEVCGTKMESGHLQTFVNGKRYLVHRIIYFMATGVDPLEYAVDHINGDPQDNSIDNLRLATKRENSRHKVKLSVNNTSGYRNVSWSKTFNCWLVSITANGKRIQHKFKDLIDAAKAAQELRSKYYGEFCGTVA